MQFNAMTDRAFNELPFRKQVDAIAQDIFGALINKGTAGMHDRIYSWWAHGIQLGRSQARDAIKEELLLDLASLEPNPDNFDSGDDYREILEKVRKIVEAL